MTDAVHKLSYYFSTGEDFQYFEPDLFYVEEYPERDAAIAINVSPRQERDLGDLVFLHPYRQDAVLLYADGLRYVETATLLHAAFWGRDASSSPATQRHRDCFRLLLEHHPLGGVLGAIYEGRRSFQSARAEVLRYVAASLSDPTFGSNGRSHCDDSRLSDPQYLAGLCHRLTDAPPPAQAGSV